MKSNLEITVICPNRKTTTDYYKCINLPCSDCINVLKSSRKMANFAGFVFGNNVDNILKPYDSNIKIASYIVYTKDQAIDKIKQQRAYEYDKALRKLSNPDLSKKDRDYYQNIIDAGLFISYEDAWEIAKSWGYEVDVHENLISSYNPKGKWIWYTLGGDWFILKTGEIANYAKIKDIDWDKMFKFDHIPFYYVTESGEWRELAKYLYYEVKDLKTWDTQLRNYIESLDPDTLVTAINFYK